MSTPAQLALALIIGAVLLLAAVLVDGSVGDELGRKAVEEGLLR